MRVTEKVKQQTEAAILAAGRRLFLRKGLEGTSTREIAKAAKVGVGTVFNYFESKEALAHALAGDLLESARGQAWRRIEQDAASGSSLEMDLFTLVVMDLRALGELRGLMGELVEMGFGSRGVGGVGGIRAQRVADAERVLAKHGREGTAPLMHLYWSLYLGVLSFWSRDSSPSQEDTLSLLDQAIRMFTSVVGSGREGNGVDVGGGLLASEPGVRI